MQQVSKHAVRQVLGALCLHMCIKAYADNCS